MARPRSIAEVPPRGEKRTHGKSKKARDARFIKDGLRQLVSGGLVRFGESQFRWPSMEGGVPGYTTSSLQSAWDLVGGSPRREVFFGRLQMGLRLPQPPG